MKLKHKDIKPYREQALALQNNCCALCQEPILDDAVLDHDHKSGLLRAVLHRGCNSMLGKIENNLLRSQIDYQRLRTFALNLVDYIQTTHTGITHPTHKTAEERKELSKIRRKRNASKKRLQSKNN